MKVHVTSTCGDIDFLGEFAVLPRRGDGIVIRDRRGDFVRSNVCEIVWHVDSESPGDSYVDVFVEIDE